MFTLLGSLLGFATSLVPEILNFFREKRDQKHELALMDRQLEHAKVIGDQKMAMVEVEADTRETEALYEHASAPSGSGFIDGLRGSVRPVITYQFHGDVHDRRNINRDRGHSRRDRFGRRDYGGMGRADACAVCDHSEFLVWRPAISAHSRQSVDCVISRRLCAEAINIVKHFEGFCSRIYICPAGHPTIGFGHVVRAGERFIEIDLERGEELLRRDLATAKRAVGRLIRVPLDDGKFGALASFTFNLGSGRLQSSTLRMKLNRGDLAGAANEFPKWRRANGRILAGLVKRRAAERALFLRGAV